MRTTIAMTLILGLGTASGALAQDAGADEDGAQEELHLHPIPSPYTLAATAKDEDVAFRYHHVEHPERVLVLLKKDWDDYFRAMKAAYKPTNRHNFTRRIMEEFADLYAMQLHFYEQIPEVEAECRRVVRKLERGVSWKRVVKVHSDDSIAAKEEGRQGQISHRGFRYPVEMALFDPELKGVVGPYWTKWGLEVFRINEHGGDLGTLNQWVDVDYILMVYQGESSVAKPKVEQAHRVVRMTSPHPEFQALISPGRMFEWPESAGSRGLAPLGQPDMDLTDAVFEYYLPEERKSAATDGD